MPARRTARRLALALAVLLLALLPAAPAWAALSAADLREGVLVRVGGDVAVTEAESIATVVVVGGDLALAGESATVVVVDGTATLRAATVATLVVVGGEAVLAEGTVVTGDLIVPNSTVVNDGSSRIEGDVVEDLEWASRTFTVVNVVLGVGAALAVLVAALLLAGVAPGTVRSAIRGLHGRPGGVALSGLVFWIALPLAGVVLLLTVLGAPTALGVWFLLMPAVAGLGYLVSAIWVGQLLVDRRAEHAHPYAAALVGAVLLLAVGLVPILGAFVGLVATIVGASALTFVAWQAIRSRPAVQGPPPGPAFAYPGPGAAPPPAQGPGEPPAQGPVGPPVRGPGVPPVQGAGMPPAPPQPRPPGPR